MRHVKRAARADLHRFKAFIEMQELETGAWRGVIEDGELVEDHDPEYDEERDYSDIDEIRAEAEEDSDDRTTTRTTDEKTAAASQDEDEDQQGRTQRFKRQAERTRRGRRQQRLREPLARRGRVAVRLVARTASSSSKGGSTKTKAKSASRS